MLRSTVACLREKRMDVEALGCLEQSLWLQRRMLGAENPQVRAALEEVVLGLNALAMQFLSSAAAFDQCLALLRKAEAITAPGNFSTKAAAPLQVLTLNNLGCCYRKLGKPRAALRYLQEAARIGGAIGEGADRSSKEATTVVVNLSVTHLNLCAIQSQLGRHELALEHAQAAIFHAQDELVRLEEDDGTRGRRLDDGAREEKLVSLAVAYHNLAVELEFNGRGDASLQWFRKALELASRYRERNAALCASFQRALDDAKRKHGPSRPKSASSSRPGARSLHPRSSRAREPKGDVSYQATVASKCYRPLRPSVSSSNTAGAGRSAPPAAAAAPSGQNARRQRPMSASSSSSRARQPVSDRLYGSSSTTLFSREQGTQKGDEPALDRHWRKLERQYDLDEGCNDSSGSPHRRPTGSASAWKADGSPQRAEHQRRRPLSASAASMRTRVTDSRPETHDQDEDDDCGVFEDDALSDDEELVEGYAVDGRCESRRDRPSPSKLRQSGRRHQEALSYSRSTTSCASDSDEGDSGEPGDVSSGYAGEDDDPDLPRQRVSHMAYLRRMKKVAESIRDDMGQSPGKRPSGGHDSGGKNSKASKGVDPPHQVGEMVEAIETPRSASLSKMRAKLERMRSDSLLSLLDKREEGDVEVDTDVRTTEQEQQHSNQPGHSSGPQSIEQTHAKVADGTPDSADTTASKLTLLLVEDANVFATSAQIFEGELKLVQVAAARLLQRFYRGSSCRRRLQRANQVSCFSQSLVGASYHFVLTRCCSTMTTITRKKRSGWQRERSSARCGGIVIVAVVLTASKTVEKSARCCYCSRTRCATSPLASSSKCIEIDDFRGWKCPSHFPIRSTPPGIPTNVVRGATTLPLDISSVH
jgi:tetratricopeptide (TPR) repeat protein